LYAQTPLVQFVVQLVADMLYNSCTANQTSGVSAIRSILKDF